MTKSMNVAFNNMYGHTYCKFWISVLHLDQPFCTNLEALIIHIQLFKFFLSIRVSLSWIEKSL